MPNHWGFNGYNSEEISKLRNVINNAAQSTRQIIVGKLNTSLILPISAVWYAPEAITFFEQFAEVVKKAGINITETFDNFRSFVETAGKDWALTTGGEAPSLASIDQVELILDVSSIKAKNSNGDVGINIGEAFNITKINLPQLKEEIKEEIKNLTNSLNAETAFIGGEQASAIEECFVSLTNQVYTIFNFLTEGENSLIKQIEKTAIKYENVSSDVVKTFTNNVM